jgi:hypothetical protein
MPEGPAFVQAIRQLATVNWGGTQQRTTEGNSDFCRLTGNQFSEIFAEQV